MTESERNEHEWRDPANWRAGLLGVYRAPRDARVWVPKRNRAMGWTVNVARAEGKAWTAFFVGLVIVCVALAANGL